MFAWLAKGQEFELGVATNSRSKVRLRFRCCTTAFGELLLYFPGGSVSLRVIQLFLVNHLLITPVFHDKATKVVESNTTVGFVALERFS